MPDKIIDAYDRGDHESQRVQAQVSEFKGRKYFSFRAWYPDGESHKPGKNGINLPVDEYSEFRKLVAQMDEELGYEPEEPE